MKSNNPFVEYCKIDPFESAGTVCKMEEIWDQALELAMFKIDDAIESAKHKIAAKTAIAELLSTRQREKC